MDCGEVYIKMCEKAVEIQRISVNEENLQQGDVIACILPHPTWYGHEELHKIRLYTCDGDWSDYTCSAMGDISPLHEPYTCGVKDHYIWLPRQDQLQEMCKEKRAFVLSKRFDDDMENYITGDPDTWSMEQLWLAFVMKEKYHKIWDGENWKLC